MATLPASPVPPLLPPSDCHAEHGALEPARSPWLRNNRGCCKKKDGLFVSHKTLLPVAEGSVSPERSGCIVQESINIGVKGCARSRSRCARAAARRPELSPCREALPAGSRCGAGREQPCSHCSAAEGAAAWPGSAAAHGQALLPRRGRHAGVRGPSAELPVGSCGPGQWAQEHPRTDPSENLTTLVFSPAPLVLGEEQSWEPGFGRARRGWGAGRAPETFRSSSAGLSCSQAARHALMVSQHWRCYPRIL